MYIQPTTTYGSLIPGSEYIRSLVRQGTISEAAARRLRWLDHYYQHRNARLTCRYFGISPQTFYRWKRRFDPYDLRTLEEESHRPLHVRQAETPATVRERILELSQEYPRWGRDKLAVLLKREGIKISGSTVGREMAKLKARGLLLEPENVRRAKLARKRRRKPRYATRMPRGYRVEAPGDLVEVDTLRVSLILDEERFHFSAWDKVTRLVGMKAYKRQTSTAAADFLYHLRTKFPFPIKAIQIDGGSEFMDQFEEACGRAEILLFQNPPGQPERNGGVERSNRTHREEFYEVEDVSLNLEEHNQQLASYEYDHNHIRPHWALELKTAIEYYLQWKKIHKPKVSPTS